MSKTKVEFGMVSNNVRFANRAKLSLPKAAGSFGEKQEVQTELLDATSPEAAFSDAVTGVDATAKVDEKVTVQAEHIAVKETAPQPEPAPVEVALDSFPAESFAEVSPVETSAIPVELPTFELTQEETPLAEKASSGLSLLQESITSVIKIDNSRPAVTSASCVKALEKSLGFGRSSFYLEVGVCLAVFASSSTGADLATKKIVREIYQKAGYDVQDGGRDYKTVSRRVVTCAKLFDKLGADAINSAMRGMRDLKAIESLCGYLGDTRKFDTMNAVREYIGEPVIQTNTPEVRAARSAALVRSLSSDTATDISIDERVAAQREVRAKKELEETEGITVFTSTLTINLPRDVTSFEVRAMANKLIEFAERMEEELGTPADQRNREMHS